MTRVRLFIALVTAIGLFLLPSSASATTVVNGNFETGSLSGWTVQTESGSSGSWFAYTGTTSPLAGHTVFAPPEGTHAAITDETNPTSTILYQDIALEPSQKHALSLVVYYSEPGIKPRPISNPNSLDYKMSGNQQYRIDVLRAGAAPDSLAPSDILATVFQTKTGDPTSVAPTHVTVDLTPFAGQTVRLRAAVVAGGGPLNAGLDAVQVSGAPIASTLPVSGVTTSGATLNGTVNPDGDATTYRFEYGTTPFYGSSAPVPDAGTGSDFANHPVTQAISGLQPGKLYHYRIVATNPEGTTASADTTFTTAPLVAASISGATETHRKWRLGNHLISTARKRPPVGTTFKFTLSKPATVRLAFTQLVPGRKVNGKCVAQNKKNRKKHKCKRTVTRGTFTFAGHAGLNTVHFEGRISKSKKLKPGKYTLLITATTPGAGSNSSALTFTIVR